MQLAVGRKLLATSGQYLVTVGLMAHIPYNAVIGCIVDVVQSHGQLHHTQPRGQVARVHRCLLDNHLSKFATKLWQLLHLQPSDVGRAVNGFQYRCFLFFHLINI